MTTSTVNWLPDCAVPGQLSAACAAWAAAGTRAIASVASAMMMQRDGMTVLVNLITIDLSWLLRCYADTWEGWRWQAAKHAISGRSANRGRPGARTITEIDARCQV